MENDELYLKSILEPLIAHPEDLRITRSVDEMGVLLKIDLNREDMGKVIGRSGETAKAIRLILRVFGGSNNKRINMKINEPEGSERRPRYENDFKSDKEMLEV